MNCKLQIDDKQEYVRLYIQDYDRPDQNEGDLIYTISVEEVPEVLDNLITHQIMNSSQLSEQENKKFKLMIEQLDFFLYDTQERIAQEKMVGGENKPL